MHKNTKLTPANRKEIYELWLQGKTVTFLSNEFRVTRKIIYMVLKRARLKDFSIHKSTNHRFKKAFYGLKHLSKTEKKVLGRLAKRANRYEKDYPGEMVHFDSKALRRVKKDDKKLKTEYLFIAIDDYSRQLFADVLPTKNQDTAAVFLETILELVPYKIECAYSDNGCEFKGNKDHDFVWTCERNGIEQRYTRVGRPQTNGKAERVIRTIMEECLRKYSYETREERRKALQKYVYYYNMKRPHSALKKGKNRLTPCQIIQNFLNQKVYITR